MLGAASCWRSTRADEYVKAHFHYSTSVPGRRMRATALAQHDREGQITPQVAANTTRVPTAAMPTSTAYWRKGVLSSRP